MFDFLRDNIDEYIIIYINNIEKIRYLISYEVEKNSIKLICEEEVLEFSNIEIKSIKKDRLNIYFNCVCDNVKISCF